MVGTWDTMGQLRFGNWNAAILGVVCRVDATLAVASERSALVGPPTVFFCCFPCAWGFAATGANSGWSLL